MAKLRASSCERPPLPLLFFTVTVVSPPKILNDLSLLVVFIIESAS